MQTTMLRLPLAQNMLRQNIGAIAASLFAVMLLCLLFSVFLLQKDLRRDALYKADTLASNLADSLSANDMRAMQSLLLNASNASELQAITIYDKRGQALLAWTASGQLQQTAGIAVASLTRRLQTELGFRQVSASAPVLSGASMVGNLHLQASTWPLYRHALQFLLYGLALVASAAALGGYLLTQRQLKLLVPLFDLSVLAEKVATLGDYSLRAAHDGRDALGQLSLHFNQVLARMQAWESDMHSEARERREAERRLAILDSHDSLTKLPNRHYFHKLLSNCVEDAVAGQELAALMFIDLDNFKALNDEYGYDAGDLILATMANRLCAQLRGTDTLCRVDGDEFAAILPRIGDLALAQNLAERLILAVRQPMLLRGKQLHISASIGIACCPLHAREQRLFLHNTDLALKAAKLAGRGNWHAFSATQISPAAMQSAN